jgi:hypothetical protein
MSAELKTCDWEALSPQQLRSAKRYCDDALDMLGPANQKSEESSSEKKTKPRVSDRGFAPKN